MLASIYTGAQMIRVITRKSVFDKDGAAVDHQNQSSSVHTKFWDAPVYGASTDYTLYLPIDGLEDCPDCPPPEGNDSPTSGS